jgi:biopolymer transport protein TolR
MPQGQSVLPETTMGMAAGGNKGGSIAEMNVVPLIDILLVLLIIFMVITPLTPTGIEVMIPQPNADEHVRLISPAIVVQVLSGAKTDKATLKINNQDATWESLGSRMDQIFRERAEKVAFVRGDSDVMFTDVARAIDIMRGAGIDKVGLMTAKLEAGQ